jgi:hypothetical protein
VIDVPSDRDYQLRYRKYWRMNVGRFSERFYENYFELLKECQAKGEADIGHVVHRLCSLKAESRGLQFSFASKVVHMVDHTLPVYDSYVAAFFFFSPPTKKTLSVRIETLVQFYKFLQAEYSRILDVGLLRVPIKELRRSLSIFDAPAERIIDWLLWGWVSYMRKGAQTRREVLYR